MKKRFISALLVFCLVLAVFPTTVLATGDTVTSGTSAQASTDVLTTLMGEDTTRADVCFAFWSLDERPFVTATQTFSDVKKEDWFFSAVDYACKQGLMAGTASSTFAPNDTVTRGQAAVFVYRWYRWHETDNNLKSTVNGQPFADVPSGSHYTEAINWLSTKVTNLGDKFRPGEVCTKEDFMVFLYGAVNGSADANDKVSAWKWANENGLIYSEETFSGHTWDAGEVTKEPSCNELGIRTYTCTTCQGTVTETIKALGHSWDNGTITKEPTSTETGVKTFTCSRCQATKTEVIAALDSELTTTDPTTRADVCFAFWSLDERPHEVPQKQFTDVDKEDWFYPAVGYVYNYNIINGVSNTTFAPDGTVTRAQAAVFVYRWYGTNNNLESTTNGQSFADIPSHSIFEDAVNWLSTKLTNLGAEFRPYEVCTKEDFMVFLYGAVSGSADANDKVSAWNWANSTGVIYTADTPLGHTWDEGTVTTMPTCSEMGVKTYTCTGCGGTKTEEITVLDHTLTKTEAKAATCTEDGNNAYWTCSECHKVFSDAEGKNETTVAAETISKTLQKTFQLGTHITITLPDDATTNRPLPIGTTIQNDAELHTVTEPCYWDYDAEKDEMKIGPGDGAIDNKPTAGGIVIREGKFYRYANIWNVSPSEVTMYMGETYKLDVEFSPSDAYLNIYSSDTSVVTVSQDGTLAAVGCGTATIGISDLGKGGPECTVTVLEKPSVPIDPVDPSTPEAPEQPVEPEQPDTPEEPEKPEEPATPSMEFTDVSERDYFYDAVVWAVENGITTGATDTTFDPNGTCTRAQVVTFLWRAAGKPEPVSTENPFDDVTADQYYYKAVLWAVENGITNGTSETAFSPNDPCTRAQVVTFLWRAEGKPDETADTPFADVKADEYYAKAVQWAVTNSITNGTSDTTFSPGDDCKRGQVVTFLYRAAVEN